MVRAAPPPLLRPNIISHVLKERFLMQNESFSTPTHRSIAQAVGVAPSTVSLALRNDPRVARETVAKVRSVAEEMGYRANPSVSMWMAHVRTARPARFQEVMGYVHTVPRNHSSRRYMPFDLYRKGAGARAQRLGYQLRDFELHEEGMTSDRLRKMLDAQAIRGVIFEHTDSEEFNQYTLEFDWTGLSAVTLGARPSDLPVHTVSSNHFDGARLAYQKLIELGYRRIGLSLHMLCDRSLDFETSGGFLCAQSLYPKASRIPIHNTDVYQGWDRRGFCEWFERYRPDVVISPNSEIFEFLKYMALRVPEDVGWVHLAKASGSCVAGVEHHAQQIGSAAIDLLSNFLHMNETGQVEVIRRELIEPTWIQGSTVRTVPIKSPLPSDELDLPLRIYSRERDWQAPGQTQDCKVCEGVKV